MELPGDGALYLGFIAQVTGKSLMLSLQRFRPAARWTVVILGALALVSIVAASIPEVRRSLLRSAGHFLVAQDAPAKADIIVISIDALGAGVLEAADLVHSGFATRVAIFDRPPAKVQREFARRGVQSLDLTAVSVHLLHAVGVEDVVVIPVVVGTVDEGEVLRNWCVANGIRSILFISTPDHSRRTRRVLNRALDASGVKVTVRYSPYSDFDPETWWHSRAGQRVEAVESEKLLVDLMLHPVS